MTAIAIDPRRTGPLSRNTGEYRVPVSALVARSGQVDYKPAPIKPEWVLAGNPQARTGPLVSSPDGCGSSNFWDCTAGKFEWHYAWDETVMIVGGEVRVTDSAGATSVLRAGDVAHFQAGTAYTWDVDTYVRKIAFHRKPVRTLSSVLHRYGNRIAVATSVIAVAVAKALLRRESGG